MVDASTLVRPAVLREYALLADGERGALIGPRGDIAWLCVPRWDCDAVFSALIGGAGVYAVTPSDPWFVWGGHYEEGSLIWRSRWMTSSGAIECREALAFPADAHAAVVLRRITAVDRPADVQVVLDPRAGFGRQRLRELRLDGDVGRGARVRCTCGGPARSRPGKSAVTWCWIWPCRSAGLTTWCWSCLTNRCPERPSRPRVRGERRKTGGGGRCPS